MNIQKLKYVLIVGIPCLIVSSCSFLSAQEDASLKKDSSSNLDQYKAPQRIVDDSDSIKCKAKNEREYEEQYKNSQDFAHIQATHSLAAGLEERAPFDRQKRSIEEVELRLKRALLLEREALSLALKLEVAGDRYPSENFHGSAVRPSPHDEMNQCIENAKSSVETALISLADFYSEYHRFSDAEPILQEAVKFAAARLENEKKEQGTSWSYDRSQGRNYGNTVEKLVKVKIGQQNCEGAENILTKQIEIPHSYSYGTCDVMCQIEYMYSQEKKYVEAERMFKKIMALPKECSSENTTFIAKTIYQDVLKAQNRNDEATALKCQLASSTKKFEAQRADWEFNCIYSPKVHNTYTDSLGLQLLQKKEMTAQQLYDLGVLERQDLYFREADKLMSDNQYYRSKTNRIAA